MRKKLAAFLCALLCLTAFTGCSADELSYLQMGIDISNQMQQSETKGSTDVTVNLDTMKKLVDVAAQKQGMTAEDIFSSGALSKMTGTKTFHVDYTFQMDMNTMTMLFDTDLTYNGKTYSFGNWYYAMLDGVYVSTETAVNMYTLLCDIAKELGQDVSYGDAFAADWKAAMEKQDYICLFSLADLGIENDLTQIPETDFAEVYQAALDFYKNAFDGFTTGMISKTETGYRLQATGTQAGELVVSVMDYIIQNPEKFLTALENYLVVTMEASAVSQEDIKAFKDSLAVAKQDMESLTSVLVEAKSIVQGLLSDVVVAEVLAGTNYVSDVQKTEKGYSYKETYTMNYANTTMLDVKSDAVIASTTKAITLPQNSMSMTDAENTWNGLVDKHNPVTSIAVTWVPAEDDGTASVTLIREKDALSNNSIAFIEYATQQDGTYVPLRAVCDMLGKDVGWDKATRTASVDGTAVETTLLYGVSYINLTDFDTLGYTVTTTQENGVYTAKIA